MKKQNLSEYNSQNIPSGEDMRVGIVVSKWNPEITEALLDGAIETLTKNGVSNEDIVVKYVPGSFELIQGAKLIAENLMVDAVIVIGCVIRGETPHFDYISQAVALGIGNLNENYDVPFIFTVLTTENMEQAKDRAGGNHGNKGVEGAITAIEMIALQDEIISELEENSYDMFEDEEGYDDEGFED